MWANSDFDDWLAGWLGTRHCMHAHPATLALPPAHMLLLPCPGTLLPGTLPPAAHCH
jgi:hypothetical protein